MNSESNRKELARACGKNLPATRMASVEEVGEDVLSKKGRYVDIKDNLKAKEVVVGDGMRLPKPYGHRAQLQVAQADSHQDDLDVSLAARKNRGACENMRAVAFDRANCGERVQ